MSQVNPLRAPVPAASNAGLHSGPSYVFRSPLPLGNGVQGVVAAFLILALVLVGVMGHGLQLLQQGIDGTAAADLQDRLASAGRLQSSLVSLQMLLLLASCVWAACWLHRVACNARALGAKGLDDSPAWAIGWYAVPVMNLVLPLRAMTQIWLGSAAPGRWQKLPMPRLLAAWWCFWIGGNLYGSFVTYYLKPEHTFTGLHAQQQLLIGAQLLNLVAAVLFLLVVRGLTHMQVEERERQQVMPATRTASVADAFAV